MKNITFFFPIILFFVFIYIKINAPAFYSAAIQEDSFVEYAQAFFYFLASILSVVIAKKAFKNHLRIHCILYMLLASGLLFISLEEISWGQRIFNITNPAYFNEHNVQNEISLHNLDMVHYSIHKIYILIGSYGAFAWLFTSRMNTNNCHIINFIVPDWYVSSFFFFVFFTYTFIDYMAPFAVNIGIDKLRMGVFLVWRDQEPVELLLSLGFLFFTVSNYLKLQKCLKVPQRNQE